MADKLKHPASMVIERCSWLLFDWLREPSGTTMSTYELFCEPLSPERHLNITNMHMGRTLPAPQGVLMRGIFCFYGMMDPVCRDEFRENYTLEFIIDHKIFYQVPLLSIPPTGILLPPTTETDHNNPLKQPGNMTDHLKYIAPLMQFYIRLQGKSVEVKAPGLAFLPVLSVSLDRPVQ